MRSGILPFLRSFTTTVINQRCVECCINACELIWYSHLSNKLGGWNKREGGAKNAKSLNVEGVINLNIWARVKFYSSKWLWGKLSLGSAIISDTLVMKSINV